MNDVLLSYCKSEAVTKIASLLKKGHVKVKLCNAPSSSFAVIVAATSEIVGTGVNFIVTEDRQQALYFADDLENLLQDKDTDYNKKKVLFYPSLTDKQNLTQSVRNDNAALRMQILDRLDNGDGVFVVTYPEAIVEKVVVSKSLHSNRTVIRLGDEVDWDKIVATFEDYGFEYVDFVSDNGQYAIRGGIIDVFSYSDSLPYRLEIDGEKVESIRTFDIATQLSLQKKQEAVIMPDLQQEQTSERVPVFSYLGEGTTIWTKNPSIWIEKIADKFYNEKNVELYLDREYIKSAIAKYNLVQSGICLYDTALKVETNIDVLPDFNLNFTLFVNRLQELSAQGYENVIMVKDDKQQKRIEDIIEKYRQEDELLMVSYSKNMFSGGFIDQDNKRSFFTDHQLLHRYNRYRTRTNSDKREKLTMDELISLKPGDYVTHIDYGVGRFSGLEKLKVNGREQEAIRLIYKNNDILYVSIHSLHKISRYSGKDGVEPTLNRLGSATWQNLKEKTKKRVKDIAKDLIELYAQRKASKGFAFSADSYLQNELEASFVYEDTPDQYKATQAVKHDMERAYPMDRLVCGDVGFGKTEVAIRAAFKAVADSKQVAVLVPTTILAFQHYKTFSERLAALPCKTDYINRFRSTKEKKQILQDLKDGKTDILIGTHAIVSKKVQFKDLGLLIVDEEQKFGVSVKEKIKQMKVNVDTLTLTATPIPRTLQFSLMGARDLSVINTAPLNRQPISTEIITLEDKDIIAKAVTDELNRGGQVMFVNNKIAGLEKYVEMLHRLVPEARIGVGHGRIEGGELEKIMMDFINEEFDVLVCTTIVENGLDIPNVNTIIINDAQNYGLSDLHQLRGRVGRSNKKAYCYLIVPEKQILNEQASKRLQAIVEFSSIGSGFSIAMRDLDIRGAGNILGAEQSGFISNIGYDTYNKILSEAMSELKQSEYKDLYPQEDEVYVHDCQIETDLEVLIPDNYIGNITERIKIYKDIDNISEESQIESLTGELRDRFGAIPQQTRDLFDVVRIRKMAKKIAVEKIVLKNNKCIMNFVRDKNCEFFASPMFNQIIDFAGRFPKYCRLKEENSLLQLIVSEVDSVSTAKRLFEYLLK